MMLAELIRANPEHPNAYHAYGQAMLFLGRPDDARKAFDAKTNILDFLADDVKRSG